MEARRMKTDGGRRHGFAAAMIMVAATAILIVSGCAMKQYAPVGSPSSAGVADSLKPVHEELAGQAVTPPPSRSEAEAVGRSPLVRSLDSLLLAADTLLRESQLGMHVVDLTTGKVLYARGERQRMRPASAEKVVTAVAALDCLGPSYEFTTALLSAATVSGGTLQGDLYVWGSMDPLLSAADVRRMVGQMKASGVKKIAGRLIADASLKDADEYGWGWCWDDDNPTLSPLLCGGKPTLMEQVRTALRNAGITVAKGTGIGTFPLPYHPCDTVADARRYELAAVRRPIAAVLRPMMKESDNLCAEAVFYQIGHSGAASAYCAAGRKPQGKRAASKLVTEVITAVIDSAYVQHPLDSTGRAVGSRAAAIADGSGLSLYNYQTPATFTRLLAYAAARPDSLLTPLMTAMPVAAVDGTLKTRMAKTVAAGNVHAKTGSVTAVSTLVGYTTQRSTGHLIAFAIMNQGLRRASHGRAFQDQVCVLLSQ